MEKRLYPIKEAAKILSVSYPWLDKQIRDGLVKVVKMGHKRMITVSELDKIAKFGLVVLENDLQKK